MSVEDARAAVLRQLIKNLRPDKLWDEMRPCDVEIIADEIEDLDGVDKRLDELIRAVKADMGCYGMPACPPSEKLTAEHLKAIFSSQPCPSCKARAEQVPA